MLAAFALAVVAEPGHCLTCDERKLQACPDTRWIGIKTPADLDNPCPTPPPTLGVWSVRHLFTEPEPAAEDIDLIPFGLRRFCLYEWDAAANPPATPPGDLDLWQQGSPVSLERDCLVVGPASPGAFGPDMPRWLEQRFYFEAGLVVSQGVAQPAAGAAPLRLVLLDTGPTNADDPSLDIPDSATCPEGSAPCSAHGYSLANLARGLVCGSTDAAAACGGVTIASRLAMPRVPGRSEKREAGGLMGTPGDLAEAIRSEVGDWWASAPAGALPHLVLNLSLAWDPCFGGSELPRETLPPSTQSVHAALRDAVCRGAVVVAAAGNFPGQRDAPELPAGVDPLPGGAAMPGSWEELLGPPGVGGLSCGEALAPEPAAFSPQSWPSNTRLLYAVGGVAAGGKLLPNARPDALPPRVAFGDHAAVRTLSPSGGAQGPTRPLTGTSVSTVVVSAAATAKWSRAPNLHPGEVISAIEPPDGIPGLVADICFPPPRKDAPCPLAKRIKVCEAVGLPCAGPPPVPPGIAAAAWEQAGVQSALVSTSPVSIALGCHGETLVGSSPASGCPHWSLPTADSTPWTGPEPDGNPCPGCGSKPGGSPGALLIEMDPDFTLDGAPVVLQNVRLVVGPDVSDADEDGNDGSMDDDGSRAYVLPGLEFHLGDAVASADDLAVVCGVPEVEPGESMFLSMLADGMDRSIVVPVLQLPGPVVGIQKSPSDDLVDQLCP